LETKEDMNSLTKCILGQPSVTKPNPDATSVFQYAAQDSFHSAMTSVNRVLPANSAPLDLFSFAVIVRRTCFLALAASSAPLSVWDNAPQVRFFTCLLYTREHPPMLLNLQGRLHVSYLWSRPVFKWPSVSILPTRNVQSSE